MAAGLSVVPGIKLGRSSFAERPLPVLDKKRNQQLCNHWRIKLRRAPNRRISREFKNIRIKHFHALSRDGRGRSSGGP
ncbi:hypothetical protein U1Q18_034839, partial [Sarracenia purpurea var. burkii]